MRPLLAALAPALAPALALGGLLAAGGALAQSDTAADPAPATAPADPGTVVASEAPGPITMTEVDDDAIVAPFGIAAGLLDDIDVYTAEGVEIGDVEEILGPDRETATHLAVDFDDDAGWGERDVVAPVEAFALEADRLVISLAPADLAALPTWQD